ncbi:MAG: tRNA (adenosine(37)-N6)-threonylcarbamoyltransferase complex ATPase subunit type 1 TsaE, partial [Candidatus Dormiibacterota bacterium]
MSHSPTETLILGEALGRSARPGDVILLAGPLGAGKTVLVQGIAAGLGSVATVGSPTFVLVRQYNGRLPLVHADLYRLEGRKEIDGLGLLELSEPGVLVVEWADRAPWLSGTDRLSLTLGAADDPDWRTLALPEAGPLHLVEALI